jgi:6-pyruvoyltetrahydropterin/6-carboxytetrahydropterin synthase
VYSVAVGREFTAQHYLVGGDWGAENQWHSHHYRVEVRLEGRTLDGHGYLVDIVAIEEHLTALVARYRDTTLNDLPEFAGLNPSLEHFCRLFCAAVAERLRAPTVSAITVTLWENAVAWAAYRQELPCGSA